MAVKDPVLASPSAYPRRNWFSYNLLFNVIGWGVLLLVVVFLVYPSVVNGRWKAFGVPEIQQFLLDGLWVTLQVAVYSVFLSFIIGIFFALGRLSNFKIISIPSAFYIELMRALPSYLIIFYVFIGLPKLGVRLDAVWAAVVGLTIYTSAVLAEIVRAGILSVEKGQLEAAYSLGLKPTSSLLFIVLPQALRRMVPAIVSQLITLIKDTSLAGIIALQELTAKGIQLYRRPANAEGTGGQNILETMFVVAMIYFVICYILSVISQRLEVRQKR